MMGNIVFVIYRPARQVLAAGMRTVVTGGGGTGAVDSVNGQTGVVVLTAADVGADPAGTATTASAAAVAAHTALADPHPQYLTPAEGNTAYDALGAATSAVSAHVAEADPHPQYTTQSEGDARYERGLTAGANITIDRTNPVAPVISASGGGGGGAVDSVNGQTGVVVLDAADVGADAAGTAAAAVAAHVAATNPHPEYLTQAEGDTAYAPIAHVGAGGAAHANAVAAGAAGFMTGADKMKLDGIAAGAQVNVGTNISVGYNPAYVFVNSSTGTDDTIAAATDTAAGVLSAADKAKLDGIATGATQNSSDAFLLARGNHTGSQTASTISDFAATVRATVLTGFTLVAGGTVLAADSLLVAVGKLQKQINDLFSGKQDTLVSGSNIKTVNGSTLLGSGDLVVTGGASLPAIRAITGNETLGLLNINTFGVNSTVSNYVSTIPAQATVAWTADAEMHFLPSNTGDITVTAAAGVSLNGVVASSVVLNTQNGAASIKRLSTDSWWIGGIVDGGGGSSLASFRNKLINGNFKVNQRAYVSATVTGSANTYTLDRWRVVTSGEALSFSTSGNGNQITAPAGGVEQVIEGVNIEGGTYVLGWTGTATATVNGTARTPGETFTLTADTDVTVRFTGGTVSLAQLEPGSSVTAFEHRPYGLELALCQRYYWRGLPCLVIAFGSYVTNAYYTIPVSFPVTMRAVPTVARNTPGISYISCGNATTDQPTVDGLRFYVRSTGVANAASATFAATDYISAEAEI